VKMTGSQVARSVATTAMGMRKSSNWRASKTRSIKSDKRWLLARPRRGDAPARNITKLKVTAGGKDFRQGCATGIGCAENAADAGARDVSDRNVILSRELAGRRDARSRARIRREGESDARTRFCGACLFFAADWDFATHE